MKFKWKRGTICLLLAAIALFVYEIRLVQWQVVEGNTYSQISDDSSSLYIKLDGARGQILDRNGLPLAGNETVYNVVMNALTMDSDRNPAILGVLNILREDNVKWVDKLPIRINERGEYEFIENRTGEINYLKGTGMLNLQSYATADDCMAALVSRYDCEDYSRQDARDIISVRYYMTKTQFSRTDPHTIATDVPIKTIEKISERIKYLPGIEIEVTAERDYDDGAVAPHIIGNLGAVSAEQYAAFEAEGNIYSASNVSGYSYSDRVGQTGIENVFESTLRGKNGKESVALDGDGNIVSTEITEAPSAGNSVKLTLDKNLQLVVNDSLERNIYLANEATGDCIAGGAVVLDVDTFGVLAAGTFPTYDLGLYTTNDDYYYDLLEDEGTPLINRAFNGIFTPGSVFKPVVAIASLEENVINDSQTHYCPGYYDYYDEDEPPTCYNSTEHGYMNVADGIKYSCNVFFFDVGRMLRIDRMNVYTDAFGLGVKTGLELYESAGIMSNPDEYYSNHGIEWTAGLTIQSAIGQCDSMFTPLQLATYCATIANDGIRLNTHLYSETVDYSGKELIERYEPVVACDSQVSKKTIKIVQKAMRTVCSDTGGTAYSTFGDYGIAIAAKTGTAENANHSDNTVFIAYAPYEKPEIAIAVVLEYGKYGQYSQAVAKDIFDYYFYGEYNETYLRSDENGNIYNTKTSDLSQQISQKESEDLKDEEPGEELPEGPREPTTNRGDDIPDDGGVLPGEDIDADAGDEIQDG